MKVLQYPLTLITFFFVVGIIFNRYVNLVFTTGLYVLAFSFFIFILTFFAAYRTRKAVLLKFFTLFSFLLSFAVGNFTAVIHDASNNKGHYSMVKSNYGEPLNMKVVIMERWKSTVKNERYVAELYEVNGRAATGKILLNFRKENNNKEIKIGMKLGVHSKIWQLQKPLNPDQFDYGSFLKNKSIYGQSYIDESSFSIFSTQEKNMYYYSAIFRNKVMTNLKNSGFNQKELAVVHALILGQRQDLDATVLQNYQYAGAIHILSVSGLHVGFILLFLNYFLDFLPNTSRFRSLKVLVTILILWSFALVAGFTPSVVRSVTMFSFVAIGLYMRRKTYVFYTFYCSLLFILLFEPSFLFDVGFQLSYMALFFIIWLQPEFTKMWQPKNKIVGYLWSVFTITFAAQLGTMPLSLYYFHQFPGLFFVTNLLIMFLITIIMGVGLLLVLIAFWTEIPVVVAKVLEKLIWVLNYIVEVIASFESFLFKDISFNFWMMSALYLVIFSLGWFIIKPSFRTSVQLLCGFLLFQTSYFIFDSNSKNKEELLFFQARNSSLILERNGREIAVFSNIGDSTAGATDRNVQSYLVANGTIIKSSENIPNLLFFNGKKIIVLDSSAIFIPYLKPDIVLVTQSPKVNFDRVIGDYRPEIVIVDASNYKNVVANIRKTCLQQKIPFHAVAEKGFYRIEK